MTDRDKIVVSNKPLGAFVYSPRGRSFKDLLRRCDVGGVKEAVCIAYGGKVIEQFAEIVGTFDGVRDAISARRFVAASSSAVTIGTGIAVAFAAFSFVPTPSAAASVGV